MNNKKVFSVEQSGRWQQHNCEINLYRFVNVWFYTFIDTLGHIQEFGCGIAVSKFQTYN